MVLAPVMERLLSLPGGNKKMTPIPTSEIFDSG